MKLGISVWGAWAPTWNSACCAAMRNKFGGHEIKKE